MADPQTVYDDYVQQYGYPPKQPGHLIAHAKKSGAKIKFSDARQVITNNASSNNSSKKQSTNIPTSSSSNNKTSNIPLSNKTNTIKPNRPKTKKWPPVQAQSKPTKPYKPSNQPSSKVFPPKTSKSKSKWPPVQTTSISTSKRPTIPKKPCNNPQNTDTINPKISKTTSKPSNTSTNSKSNIKPPPAPKQLQSKPFNKTTCKPPSKPSNITTTMKPSYINNENINQTQQQSHINTMEQARLDAIARLNASNNKYSNGAKQHNKSSKSTPPRPPSKSNAHPPPKPPSPPKSEAINPSKTSPKPPTKSKSNTPPKRPSPPPKSGNINHINSSKTPPKPPPSPRPRAITNPPSMPKKGIQSNTKPPSLPPTNPEIPKGRLSETKLPHPPPKIVKKIMSKKNSKPSPPKPRKPPRSSPTPPSVQQIVADSQHNDDEKKSIKPKGTAKPFMCRVNFECSSERAKQEIYNALKLFVKLQIDTPHPGVITYHFTCANPVKYPLKLEFIELYYNESVYFQHSKSQQFGRAFFKAFGTAKNRKSRTFVTIGNDLSDLVKTTNGNLDSSFPTTDAGYLLHCDYLKALDYGDDTKLMFKFHMISPKYYKGNKKNVDLIFNIMDRLSVFAEKSYAVMFHSHRLDIKSYPDHLELISIWPNIECLLEFLQNDKVQGIMMEFKALMIKETDKMNRKSHFLCELYSEQEIGDDIMEMIEMVFDDIGYTQQLKSDIGYILHPKANSSQLN